MSAGTGSVLTIDTSAVAANYRLLRDKAGVRTAGVVKANAYGLGAARIVQTLAAEGCEDFFVVTIDEGVHVRAHTDKNIYLLGGIHSGDPALIHTHSLIPVLNSLDDIATWKGTCALHFDTGMNRTGLSADETKILIAEPDRLKNLNVMCAMSHFACADERGHPMNRVQCDRFAAIHAALKPVLPGALWSLCNSPGIFECPDAVYDMVRPGKGLYGNPFDSPPSPTRQTIQLDAVVLQVRDVKKGETVGYSASHVFAADTQTATLCIGYADGFLRYFSGRGTVYWQGQPCPVIGRVSMDLISIDIGHLRDRPKPGDLIEIIGPHQDADMLGAQTGTIGYEILTSLGMRHARSYI